MLSTQTISIFQMKMKRNNQISRGWISILCFVLNFQSGFAQGLKCENILNQPTGYYSLNDQIIQTCFDGKVFYMTGNQINRKTGEILLQSVDLKTGNTDSFSISIPKQMEIVSIPFCLAVGPSHLILLDDSEGRIFEFTKSNHRYTFSHEIVIENHLHFRTVDYLGNNKFLFSEIYSTAQPNVKPVTLAIYSAVSKKVEKVIHPTLPCMGYSFFENHNVTSSSGKIALADLCRYKIWLFDHKLNLLDSIQLDDNTNWKGVPNNELSFETDPTKSHPKLIIEKLRTLDKQINRIEGIYFYNDSILMINITQMGNDKKYRRIDFWNTKNLPQPIKLKINTPIQYEGMDTISQSRLPLLLLDLNRPVFKNGKLIGVQNEDIVPKSNSSAKFFQSLKNEYYDNQDPKFSVQVYAIGWD